MFLQIVSILVGITLFFGLIYLLVTYKKKPNEPKNRASKSELDELKRISVSVEVQDLTDNNGKVKIVIGARNTSKRYFTGNVAVNSVDDNGLSIDWDMLPFYELAPGDLDFSSCWLKTAAQPSITTEVTGQFE